MIDSGFRSGTDIGRALALGANAVQVGRATLYALASGGEDAVAHALAILKQELDVVQALTGARRVEHFHPGMIYQSTGMPLGGKNSNKLTT
ncbi:alpha-hydroxy-acid oxidizing protein [Phyllobacterium sp. K27]